MLTLCALCALASPELELGFDLAVAVGTSRLAASNPTARPELVLLSDPKSGRHSSFVVPAFGRVELRFAPGSVDGLELRVVTRDESGVHTTSAWSLDTLRDAGDCVWFDVDRHPFHAWGRDAPLELAPGARGRVAVRSLCAAAPGCARSRDHAARHAPSRRAAAAREDAAASGIAVSPERD